MRITLKPEARLAKQKHYLIKWEARKGLENLIEKFLEYGLLKGYESEYNIPIL